MLGSILARISEQLFVSWKEKRASRRPKQ